MSKLNILLLSSVLRVIWVGNILSMHFVNYLLHMELFTTRLVLTQVWDYKLYLWHVEFHYRLSYVDFLCVVENTK